MRRVLLTLTPVGILAAGCATPSASVPLETSEQAISRNDLPPAAMDRLASLAGGAPLEGFEREDRRLYDAYEGEWLTDDVEHEATVLADGSVLETELTVWPEGDRDIPTRVLARVRELEARGLRVEVARRRFMLYDLTVEDDQGRRINEILLRPDGSDATTRP